MLVSRESPTFSGHRRTVPRIRIPLIRIFAGAGQLRISTFQLVAMFDFLKRPTLEDELFKMRFTAKSLVRNSKKCEKNQIAQKLKLKQAIEKGNMEGAKIYAQNAIREKTQALSYLQLSSRIDAVAARVQTAISMGNLKSNMSGVVKGMNVVMDSMNVEKISKTMDQFERQFEDLDVRAAYMEGAMNSTTAGATPADQVDDLIQMVADENGLVIAGQLDSAGAVGSHVPVAAPAAAQATDDLTARLAALRKA
ncbi:hypothetical protein DYB38_006306 [Aphanomyces astaci]|uniref:Charged multivesicular body protein 1b n=1 Tax=Aphanomyces astaci TaxID=112090 RepID=A0A397D3J4_APHAT|nr:hypothetical protein DYB38_006306 [Aphanomyces astaci]